MLLLATATLGPTASAQEIITQPLPPEIVLSPGEEVFLESPIAEPAGACCSPLAEAFNIYAPCRFPRVFALGENLWLKRDTGDNLVFATGINAGNVFSLGTRELMFDHEPGLRATIGYAFNCHTYIEASYFGLYDWAAVNQLNTGGPILITSGAAGILNTFDSQAVNYSSALHSAELNLRTYVHVYPHTSVVLGTRFIHYDEDFNAVETGTVGGIPAIANLQKATNNNMIGVHIGLDTDYQFGEWFSLGITSRIGLLSNQSEARVFRSVTNSVAGPFAFRTSQDGTDITISTEVAAVARVQVTDNLAIRGGYQLLYLGGVALGPDQLIPGLDLVQSLNDDSDLLFHGPFIGVILQWGSCN